MSLNKKTMVREIGRRTRLNNRDVQAVIDALIDVWMTELVAGGRIELENFLVLETQTRVRVERIGNSQTIQDSKLSPRLTRRLIIRAGRNLKRLLQT